MAAKVEASFGPGVEMGRDIDGASRALITTNGPVLLEGLGSVNRRSVGPGGLIEVVGRAINGNLTLLRGAGRGVIGTEVFNDIILNERVSSPAIDSKIAITVRFISAGVVDGSIFT